MAKSQRPVVMGKLSSSEYSAKRWQTKFQKLHLLANKPYFSKNDNIRFEVHGPAMVLWYQLMA
jgi:hypothetical protein